MRKRASAAFRAPDGGAGARGGAEPPGRPEAPPRLVRQDADEDILADPALLAIALRAALLYAAKHSQGGDTEVDKSVIEELGDPMVHLLRNSADQGVALQALRDELLATGSIDSTRVVVLGYSQGADTLPFMANRLPATSHRLVGFTALVAVSWPFCRMAAPTRLMVPLSARTTCNGRSPFA